MQSYFEHLESVMPSGAAWRAVPRVALLAAGMLFIAPPCPAITLDWGAVTWPQRSLTNSYDIDPNNPGNDITVVISGDTADFTGKNPQLDSAVTGGTNSPSLDLTTTFSAPKQSFTVTVTFNYAAGVSNVNFLLFDVDAQLTSNPPAVDLVTNIVATAVSGGVVGPSTMTGSIDNLVGGTGTNQYAIGVANSSQTGPDGNVAINFGNTSISSFSFTYMNANTNSSGISQHFAMYDINYSPKVPEVGVAFAPLALGLLAFAVLFGRRVKVGRPASR